MIVLLGHQHYLKDINSMPGELEKLKHINLHMTEDFGAVFDAIARRMNSSALVEDRGALLCQAVRFFEERHNDNSPPDERFRAAFDVIRDNYSLIHAAKQEKARKLPIVPDIKKWCRKIFILNIYLSTKIRRTEY